ncbi:MAG TPA: TasA family protein [Candidatus Limnocylindrales bacterium]|nr:TasA family protein [Candidatus Limnocylindrales bacterium]
MDQIIVDRQIRRRRSRRRGIVALLGAVSLLTIGAGSMSLAQFTDTDASTWSFTAGTIDISTSPTVLTAVNNMMPGANATQALTVTNGGSGDLRYAISVAATNPLGTALQLTIKGPDGGVGASCALFNGASILVATTLNGAAVGNPVQGAHAGDRNLLAGANEVLCLRVSLPLTTGNASQGASSTATFTFDAEQTANNP